MSSTEILIGIALLALALVVWLTSVTVEAWRGGSGSRTAGPAGGSAPAGRASAPPAPAPTPASAQPVPTSGPVTRPLLAATAATAATAGIAGPGTAHLELGRPGSGLFRDPEPTLGRPPEFGGWAEPPPRMTVAQKSALALVGAGVAYLVWLRLNR